MANWNNPTLTSTYTNFVTEVKDRDVEAAVWFEGMSPTNLPTNAKRLNTSTGRFEKWNGSAWVDAVATFTFPALSVAGTLGVTGVATFAANPVMSGGTANGVAYLNGSKALTTGSALTFDGNNLTQSGANAAVSLQVNTANAGVSASDYSEIQLADVGTVRSYWRNLRDGSGATIFSGNDHIRFALLGSEQMRLTSTGLGIGTSSIASGMKLDVNGDANLRTGFYTNGSTKRIHNYMSGDSLLWVRESLAGVYETIPLTLDASGNLGLGVTPSAWGFGGVLQLLTGVSLSSTFGADLAFGAYYNAGWKYHNSTYAPTWYSQTGGTHKWYTAPSGTAGNAISFTQALTLDAAANLISGGTGYWQLPNGTTAQRPTGAAGQIRFNSTLSKYEGHNGSAWSSIGGGATGGGSDDVFYENGKTVTTNYTITTNKNAMSAGPITISSGITVTVPSGSTWVVV